MNKVNIYAGKTLKSLRVGKGMTQTELGKALGVSFQQVQKYEKGKDRMYIDTVSKAAAKLKVSPMVFFGRNLQRKTDADRMIDKIRRILG